MLDLFAKGLLAVLRETPSKGYTPQEIAQTLRERAGIPEGLKEIVDFIAIVSPDVAQAHDAARQSFEEVLNRLVDQRKIQVRIEAGMSYYYYAPTSEHLLG